MIGCTITLSNGPVFARTFIRDPYRRQLVAAVSNRFDGVAVHSAVCAYDLLSRRTNILYTAQSGTNMLSCSYNARSEVTGVSIDTNAYSYIYDSLGNNLYTSLNAGTNVYTVNNLNQYTSISNFVSFAPSCEIHPHYDFDGNMVRLLNNDLK